MAVYDGDGKMCQYDEGYEDYKYLYFWTPLPSPEALKRTTCVKTCPTETDEAELKKYYYDFTTNTVPGKKY